MDILIKGSQVVDASQNFTGDVYIENGVISEIGINLNKNCKTIQGRGLVLLPSFIDMHSHFREPGFTNKEDILSGSMAAVKGGYTAVNLMANTNPICSDMGVVGDVLSRSEKINLVDIHQCVSITKDFDGKTINHLDNLNSIIKCISDDGKGVLKSKVMLDAMVKAKKMGIFIMAHEEHEGISDTRLSENIMTVRDIVLAKHTGCHLHVAHVSTKEGMQEIIRAKQEGYKITCEITPHHIALNSKIDYRVNPPLREEEDIEFLIKAIKEGWVDAIGTDHAPHTAGDKEKGAPGISGIETSFSVCLTKLVKDGYITLNKLSEIMSKNPAKLLGFNKGEIKVGYDGDVVLVDLGKREKIDVERFASKGKNTPFNGMEFDGVVEATIKGGRVVYSKGEIKL